MKYTEVLDSIALLSCMASLLVAVAKDLLSEDLLRSLELIQPLSTVVVLAGVNPLLRMNDVLLLALCLAQIEELVEWDHVRRLRLWSYDDSRRVADDVPPVVGALGIPLLRVVSQEISIDSHGNGAFAILL